MFSLWPALDRAPAHHLINVRAIHRIAGGPPSSGGDDHRPDVARGIKLRACDSGALSGGDPCFPWGAGGKNQSAKRSDQSERSSEVASGLPH